MAVVFDDLATGCHRSQRDNGLIDLGHSFILAGGSSRKQRQRLVAQRLDRPERLAPGKSQRRLEGVGLGRLDEQAEGTPVRRQRSSTETNG